MTIKMTCYIHPNRETLLRCNRCEQPICNECAVLTPTGYRCKNCVKSQQKVFDFSFNNATTVDLGVGPLIALVLSAVGSAILGFVGYFGFYIIFMAPLLGWGIAGLVRRAVHRRRSKLLYWLVGAGFLAGSLLLPAASLILLGTHSIFSLLWPLVYAGLITAAGYSNIRGTFIRV